MKKTLYRTGVIFGRFQPFHLGHLEYINYGLSRTKFLYIGITNSDPSMTRIEAGNSARSAAAANPFTYFERQLMISETLREEGIDPNTFCIVPFPISRPEYWEFYVPMNAVFFVTLGGDEWSRNKLERLHSMKVEVDISSYTPVITGTCIRERIVQGLGWKRHVPRGTYRVIKRLNSISRLVPEKLK